MKIAIIGATGNVGTRLTALAVSAGHTVTAYVRDANKINREGITVVEGELTDEQLLAHTLRGTESVVVLLAAGFTKTTLLQDSLPHLINAVESLAPADRPQIIFTSVFGAQPSTPLASAFAQVAYRTLLRSFLADRTSALALLDASGLDFVTVYPVNLSPKAKAVEPDVVPLDAVTKVPGMPALSMDSAAQAILQVVTGDHASKAALLITAPGTWR